MKNIGKESGEDALKKILLVGLCLLMVFGSGCAPQSAKKNTEEDITISIGMWPDSHDVETSAVWNGYLEEMKAKYPNVTVEPNPMSYSFDSVVSMAASGTLPTVFSVYFTEPQRLIANGFIADITDFADSFGFLDGQTPQYLKIAQADGRQYGVVRNAYAMALMINKNLFKKAGLVDRDGTVMIPQTMEQMAEYAKIIRQKTGKAGFCIASKGNHGGWQFTTLALAFGARFEHTLPDGTKSSGIDSPSTVNAMRFLKRLRWEEDVLPHQNSIGMGDYVSLFSNGEAAMVFAAPDATKNMILQGSVTKDDIIIAPIPAEKSCATLQGGTMYVFSSAASEKEIEACFRFLEISGFAAKDTPQMRTALERELSAQAKSGLPVFPSGISVWTDEERRKAESEIYQKYININGKNYLHYLEAADEMLVPECATNCQEMYTAMDRCIYEVLGDPSCDIEELLHNTARSFENFYYFSDK